MKYRILDWIRRLGLLRAADEIKLAFHRLRVFQSNRAFARAHPEMRFPPHRLAFDAYNHADWREYIEGGLRHAGVFARIIDREFEDGPLSILEWGCGPGRVVRHLRASLQHREVILYATDYNAETIDWCQQNVENVQFIANDPMPPLPFPDARFDALYCFSVFTHLSERAQFAWVLELKRVIRPGGLFICTTHGDRYRHLLVRPSERVAYAEHRLIIQDRYAEGKKWYFAIHPPSYVTDVLLAGFDRVTRERTDDADGMMQDVWSGRKPMAGAMPSGNR